MENSLDEPPSWLLLAVLNSDPTLFYVISSLVLFLLIICSALISGSEVAYFSLGAADIARCKESNNSLDKKIIELIKQPKRLLATILILNNFVNVGIVTLATFVMWEMVGERTTDGPSVALLTLIVTVIILFFGEFLPKDYAMPNNLGFARFTSPVLKLSAKIFRPLSYILMTLTSIIEKRFEKKGYDISVEELHHALEITTDENTTDEEKDILKGIVNFGTLTVKQVMRSRMDITAFDVELDFHELMDKINKSGFSRIPVYSETVDRIEGILYIKDLLPNVDQDETFEWQKLLRPSFFVPESKKIDSLLKDFQDKRVHMAIVVDEYGGTSGLITLEDIIEEIVGEINDEFDDENVVYDQVDENTFIFEGKTTLNDFCKVVDKNPVIFDEIKGESESLGGLILEIHSKMPTTGERISYDNFEFTVMAVDQKRIKKVKVTIEEKTEHED